MSFGYSIGDLIAGANLTYKLIRIMSDTRGACDEYQEAMAELCAMQQAFIQVSQMTQLGSRGGGLVPQATVNSASFIVMSSMDTIAAFLERTQYYQRRLSKEHSGGIEGNWCKIGWALFKKDELKALRDSLHTRLSSINTLLVAANHIHALPESIAKYQVVDDTSVTNKSPATFEQTHIDKTRVDPISFIVDDTDEYESDADDEDEEEDEDERADQTSDLPPDDRTLVCPDASAPHSDTDNASFAQQLDGSSVLSDSSTLVFLPLGSPLADVPPSAEAQIPLTSVNTPHEQTAAPVRQVTPAKKEPKKEKKNKKNVVKVDDLQDYVQSLVASARAEWERGAAAVDKGNSKMPPRRQRPRQRSPRNDHDVDSEDDDDDDTAARRTRDEWRKNIEEIARLNAERDIRAQIEAERLAAEAAAREAQDKERADEALKKKYIEEGKAKALEAEARLPKEPIQFKDAVGRKFTFPYHLCQTWMGMEELIKQAFLKVEVIGPHVEAGHYDLIGPDGQIVLPSIWEKVVDPGWSVTMHMWPMEKRAPPGIRGMSGITLNPSPPRFPASRPMPLQYSQNSNPQIRIPPGRPPPGPPGPYLPPSALRNGQAPRPRPGQGGLLSGILGLPMETPKKKKPASTLSKFVKKTGKWWKKSEESDGYSSSGSSGTSVVVESD